MNRLRWLTVPPGVLLAGVLMGSAMSEAQEQGLTLEYEGTARRIVEAAMSDEGSWEKLSHLTTVIGPRLSGSVALERAIEWAEMGMKSEGLENVRLQPVEVPHWVRGLEVARMLLPREKDLDILALGGSVGTPDGGLEAAVVVVEDFDELERLGRKVEGKIVLFAIQWQGYGRTVPYRYRAASRAAEFGAVAALVRSATGTSLDSPHTGAMSYVANGDRIPAAAVTVEDSEWMRRLHERGIEIRLHLELGAHTLPPAQSANVIAEIRGSELPEEIVVIGGHFDSWDVGQGAHDDGAACVAAWQALTLLRQLGLRPRRTLRVVLWTNEENGLAGARAYRQSLGDDVSLHVAAVEMDGGAERPVGFGFSPGKGAEKGPGADNAVALLRQIGQLLEPLDAGDIRPGGRAADIGPLIDGGVPGLALRTVMERYFQWHHTRADTLDKIEPENLRKATAMFAVMGYVLADMEGRL